MDEDRQCGFRLWRLTEDEQGLALRGLFHDVVWPAPYLEAQCHAQGGHQSPAPSCSCGGYVFQSASLLAPYLDKSGMVFGEAELWGEVEGHGELRGQYARPLRVYVPKDLASRRRGDGERWGIEAQEAADSLASRYGCAVEVTALSSSRLHSLIAGE